MLANGVPWGPALLLGGVFAVPVGAFIAIPAIRLSGLFLGLATLASAFCLRSYAYGQSWMFGFGRLDTRRPEFAGWTTTPATTYFLLTIALAARRGRRARRAVPARSAAARAGGLTDRADLARHQPEHDPGDGVLPVRIPGRHQRGDVMPRCSAV